MKRIQVYCSLFWLLFSLVTCVESYRLGLGMVTKPGSGFFPFAAGLVMGLLSLAVLFTSMKAKGEEEAKGRESIRWWNIVVILAATVGFAFSLEITGFLINTFIFVTLMLKVVEPQSWKTSLLGGIIAAVAAELIFNVVFGAKIPTGILGF